MTCPVVISRHYESREQAWEYLASRGFRRLLEGWRNGRWIERVGRDDRVSGSRFDCRTRRAPHSKESVS
jgi:hypothetical protein